MMPAPGGHNTEMKASRATQARIWRQFDAFTESRIPRWSGRAQAILNNEAELAASAYGEAGAAAALDSVDDREWQDYIRRLWLTVVPEAGPVIRPFLGSVAKVAGSALLRAAAEWVRVNGVREAANIANASCKGIQEQIRIGIKKGDRQRDIVMPGAFDRTVKETRGRVPVLMGHQMSYIVGFGTACRGR